ncbi:MAG: hypothetical protein HZB91_05550 [Elusimicrobia bacterium]|nr:hypothetical protein [Elusimicrobiota bacterium]
MGEPIWYRAQIKNLGDEPVCLKGSGFSDAFWNHQKYLGDNFREKKGTWMELYGPDGRMIRPSFFWGPHNEFLFWESDWRQKHRDHPPGLIARVAKGFRLSLEHIHPVLRFAAEEYGVGWLEDRATRKTEWCGMEVFPGETVTTTPSVVARYREQKPYHLGLTDARIPLTASKAERDAYEELWKLHAGELEAIGRPPRKLDPYEPLRPIPGFRILDGYGTRKPGRHSLKAVYSTMKKLTPISAEEYLEEFRQELHLNPDKELKKKVEKEWAAKAPEEMRSIWKSRREAEDFNRTQAVYLESNPTDFEVLP